LCQPRAGMLNPLGIGCGGDSRLQGCGSKWRCPPHPRFVLRSGDSSLQVVEGSLRVGEGGFPAGGGGFLVYEALRGRDLGGRVQSVGTWWSALSNAGMFATGHGPGNRQVGPISASGVLKGVFFGFVSHWITFDLPLWCLSGAGWFSVLFCRLWFLLGGCLFGFFGFDFRWRCVFWRDATGFTIAISVCFEVVPWSLDFGGGDAGGGGGFTGG